MNELMELTYCIEKVGNDYIAKIYNSIGKEVSKISTTLEGFISVIYYDGLGYNKVIRKYTRNVLNKIEELLEL